MIAVNLDRVSVTYVNEPVFRDLSWEVPDDRCLGLVGPNGAGKSTLLGLMAGEVSSDTGFVVRRKGLTVGYLPQEPRLAPGRTVWQTALGASEGLARVEAEMARIEAQLADPAVYGDERSLARALDRQARLVDEYTRLGGPGYEGRVRSTLASLGFSAAGVDLPVEALSGGQKKLVALACLLVNQPHLLLLDEPDNHLDLDGKAFLERFIGGYSGGVVIVSHDRYLLDLVSDEIVELEDGRLTHYPGNYSEYAYEKRTRLLRQEQLYDAQQKEIHRLEQAAARLMAWGQVYDNPKFSRRGQSILKRLEKIERIERPVLERRRMALELKGWRGSNKVLEIEGLCKSFPAGSLSTAEVAESAEEHKESSADSASSAVNSRPQRELCAAEPTGRGENAVLRGLNLLVWRGERVGLVGPNGSGKSVLFRLILGQDTPTAGRIDVGPSVHIGYYAQEHETLDYNRTLVDTVRLAAPLSQEAAVAFLGRFLFTYEQARGKVGNLSGGERSRLQMALLMLSGANLLLLDEPTNNLDIPSAEVLESALDEFEGTVVVISHDRYFLDRVAGRIVALEGGTLSEFTGYSDYQAARQMRSP